MDPAPGTAAPAVLIATTAVSPRYYGSTHSLLPCAWDCRTCKKRRTDKMIAWNTGRCTSPNPHGAPRVAVQRCNGVP